MVYPRVIKISFVSFLFTVRSDAGNPEDIDFHSTYVLTDKALNYKFLYFYFSLITRLLKNCYFYKNQHEALWPLNYFIYIP